MRRIRVTKEFGFEMAHALCHHEGLCKHIHGHSYQLSVTVLGSPATDKESATQGMVIDFTDLKQLVNEKIISWLDHSLVLNGADASGLVKKQSRFFGKLITVPYQPTCENLLLDFADKLIACLPEKVKLVHMLLRETPTSYCEWNEADNVYPGTA
jgi:6-pyruvoyltetrahydropterin/6-carboxytetrahydropterin synthase